jgi:MFS transporter, DHA1 family, inner membrane transport protein
LASVLAPSIALISVARGVTGLFEGVLFVVVASSVSQRTSADRLWGQINLLAGGINGSILVVISYLPDAWLGRWLFVLLVGVVVVMAPFVHGIGAFAKHLSLARARSAKLPMKLVLTIWVVTVLIYGVQSSQWAVAGIVGTHAGLSTSMIGILLSVSSLLGFAGAIIPSQRGSQPHRLVIIWLSQLVMIGAILWFFGSTGNWSYFLSQFALNCSFFVVIPFLTGLLSEVDPDGSLVARTVVVTFIGAGVGTAVAGYLFNQYGGTRFAYVLCIGIATALPFVWLALRGATAHTVRGAAQRLSP